MERNGVDLYKIALIESWHKQTSDFQGDRKQLM